MECKNCKKQLDNNHKEFCCLACAKAQAAPRTIRVERTCTCGKIEYVSSYNQLKRKCRSCSQLGNTHSQNHSAEARAKMSQARKGKPAWNKGLTDIYSEEVKKAMGAKNSGKALTQEHKENITEGLTKFYETNDGPNKGKTLTLEQRKKISDNLQEFAYVRVKYTKEEFEKLIKEDGLTCVAYESTDDKVRSLEKITMKCPTEGCEKEYLARPNAILNGAQHRCPQCSNKISQGHLEVIDFLKLHISEESMKINARPDFMNRTELDIFVPEKNFAIEYHGLVHHSERPTFFDKNEERIQTLHAKKYTLAKAAGVKLLQFFEDEWKLKPEICKSIIKNKLGLITNKIFARNCNIVVLDDKSQKAFFEENHIAGGVRAQIAFALQNEIGESISVLSLRTPFTSKHAGSIEIGRFATKKDTVCIGAFQKLLKVAETWAANIGFKTILTYSDLRFGEGKVYLDSGFILQGATKPNYYYENKHIRENRFKHKKRNDPEGLKLGHNEIAQNAALGWFRIFDCGSNIYTKELKSTEE